MTNLTCGIYIGGRRLSGNLEGYLHSDTLGAVKPTPSDLLREIEHFKSLQDKLQDLKKLADKEK